jgi:hypothetical protein
MVISRSLDRQITDPAVGMDGASGFDGALMKGIRLSADASGMRRMRIRPIPGPSSYAAITINVLRPAWRPRESY